MHIDVALIEQSLRGAAKRCRVALFSSLASTNATAKQMAAEGACDGTLVIAEHQSAGRGRMQRSFFSPAGTGLYMSVIVRRPLLPAHAVRLTTAAAVAVAEAVEALTPYRADIKWINDIYLDGKKVCGILTESALSSETGRLAYAVIGIGVNVAPPKEGFPSDIADIATSVLDNEQQAQGMRERLAAEILNHLMPLLEDVTASDIHARYRRRSLIPGQRVLVRRIDETPREALALDVDGDFRLWVRYDDGTTEALDSGEVSVKKR